MVDKSVCPISTLPLTAVVNITRLGTTLLTWNQLFARALDDDIAENAHELNDKNTEPGLYSNIIDDHLQNLLEDVKDGCINDLKNMLEGLIDIQLPY